MKKKSTVVLATLLIGITITLFLQLGSRLDATCTALAEASVALDGRGVLFELRQQGDDVYATVWYDPSLITYRRSVEKCVHGAKQSEAGQARFEFDADRRTAAFFMKSAGVMFEQTDKGRWQIFPWIERIASQPLPRQEPTRQPRSMGTNDG